MCLVLVGFNESDNPDQQARASWSFGEMLLISKLPIIIKQGFIATKFTFKSVIEIIRGGNVTANGRSQVGSYHLKTTFLHHLEKTSHSNIDSPFCLMIDLLRDLQGYLISGTLPQYFLQECNLLATVGRHERQIALKAIETIILDPVAAIIKCPSEPKQIYGDICPDNFVSAFNRVSTDPFSEKSFNTFFTLLSRLDEWREEHYYEQLARDVGDEVSGRQDLRVLTDMLKKIKHL